MVSLSKLVTAFKSKMNVNFNVNGLWLSNVFKSNVMWTQDWWKMCEGKGLMENVRRKRIDRKCAEGKDWCPNDCNNCRRNLRVRKTWVLEEDWVRNTSHVSNAKGGRFSLNFSPTANRFEIHELRISCYLFWGTLSAWWSACFHNFMIKMSWMQFLYIFDPCGRSFLVLKVNKKRFWKKPSSGQSKFSWAFK